MIGTKKWYVGLTLIAAGFGLAWLDRPADAAGNVADEATMSKWMEAATPGAAHARLAEQAGTWDVTVRWWMEPTAEPVLTRGTAEVRMILGGRYQEELYQGESMGRPFEGRGLTGFDNTLGKYVAVWIDTTGTGIASSGGTCDADGVQCRAEGQMTDPVTGKVRSFRITARTVDARNRIEEVWGRGPDGKEYRQAEMRYVRR